MDVQDYGKPVFAILQLPFDENCKLPAVQHASAMELSKFSEKLHKWLMDGTLSNLHEGDLIAIKARLLAVDKKIDLSPEKPEGFGAASKSVAEEIRQAVMSPRRDLRLGELECYGKLVEYWK
jgi:hypothetical protein